MGQDTAMANDENYTKQTIVLDYNIMKYYVFYQTRDCDSFTVFQYDHIRLRIYNMIWLKLYRMFLILCYSNSVISV